MNTRGTVRGRGHDDAAAPLAAPPPRTAPIPPVLPPAIAPAPPIRFHQLCKEYTELGGTKYLGVESIIETQQWLKKLERILASLAIPDAQKCLLATWQLEEAAQDWWETVTAQTDAANITWLQFR